MLGLLLCLWGRWGCMLCSHTQCRWWLNYPTRAPYCPRTFLHHSLSKLPYYTFPSSAPHLPWSYVLQATGLLPSAAGSLLFAQPLSLVQPAFSTQLLGSRQHNLHKGLSCCFNLVKWWSSDSVCALWPGTPSSHGRIHWSGLGEPEVTACPHHLNPQLFPCVPSPPSWPNYVSWRSVDLDTSGTCQVLAWFLGLAKTTLLVVVYESVLVRINLCQPLMVSDRGSGAQQSEWWKWAQLMLWQLWSGSPPEGVFKATL